MGCSNNKLKKDKKVKLAEAVSVVKNTVLDSHAKEKDIKILNHNLVMENKGAIRNTYKIKEKVGAGAYGKVYKVKHMPTKSIRAMKVVRQDNINLQDDDRKFLKEIEVLSLIDHPNIIKLYEYSRDDTNYYFFTEFAEGGELYEKINEIKNYTETDAACIMQQILSAISYLHQNNIVHRDIKPENILLETKSTGDLFIKLIDFGTANFCDKDTRFTLKVGTPYYIAPEVLKNDYNYKCDVWSAGIIMYILLSGTPPFEGKNDEEILDKVRLGKYTFSTSNWNNISEEAKDLIEKLLRMDPKKRFEAEDALNHIWVRKYAFEERVKNLENVKNAVGLRRPLEMLKKYTANQKMQQATIAFIIRHFSNSAMIRDLRNIFKEIDDNGDGSLTYEEVKNGFYKFYGNEMSSEEMMRLIQKMDQDGNGTIEFEEFLRATVDLSEFLTPENLRAAFDAFDEDKSGKLDIDEIKKILGVVDEDENGKAVMAKIMKDIDENDDGEISFEEFEMLMKKVLVGD